MSELVSCLMITRNRAHLARRAIDCFAAQSWTDRELVILDDGDEDYTSMILPYVAAGLLVRYHRIVRRDGVLLGALRNLSIEFARGEWCMQWDDDEWYHPDRIQVQMDARAGAAAVALKWTLMHVDASSFGPLSFRADAGIATPGTVLFRRDAARYDNLARGEDSRFLRDLRAGRLSVLGAEWSHMFIRCHHGSNTWELEHFIRRLRRRPIDRAYWLLARASGDIRRHPAFRLTDAEQSSLSAMHHGHIARSAPMTSA